MLPLSRILRRLGALLLGAALLGSAQASVTTQLGFAVDASGSIGNANFSLMRTGYYNAISALPTDGSIEITMYSFATGTVQVVAPTVLTVATRATILAQVNAMAYSAGSTYTAQAISDLSQAMVGSANYSSGLRSLMNIATDGVPNGGTANNQAATIAAAVAAKARGIDSLTAEVLGSSTDPGFMRDIVFSPVGGVCNNCGVLLPDGSIPTNPMTTQPWVLSVNDFQDFGRAINVKVQVAIGNDVPEPATIALAGVALLGVGVTRRRQRAA